MAKRKKRNRGGGVPFNPDVDTGTKRPVTARVAVGDVNDKFSDYPSNGLTPRRLACDMGLEIPKSHIYKKFNIPKPENGEEVLKPPQAGMMTAQQQPMETTEELKLKQEEGQAEQRQVDTIVSIANKQSEDIFREMMKPIFKMIDKAEDMDELQKVLKDEKKLRELYQDMESPELEDLIQQGIYLSHLIGRSMD